MAASERKPKIQKIIAARCDVPSSFQFKLLKKEVDELGAAIRNDKVVDEKKLQQFISMIGLWSDEQPFDLQAPRNTDIGEIAFAERLTLLTDGLLFDFVHPLLLAGEPQAKLVQATASLFVKKFEADPGMKFSDEDAKHMEHIVTACRALLGIISTQPEAKLEHLEDIIATWKENDPSKPRTPLAVIAGALDASQFWSPLVKSITDCPAVWRESGKKLKECTELLDDMTAVEASDVEKLRKAVDNIQSLQDVFDENIASSLRDRLWQHISKWWQHLKKGMDLKKDLDLSLGEVMNSGLCPANVCAEGGAARLHL